MQMPLIERVYGAIEDAGHLGASRKEIALALSKGKRDRLNTYETKAVRLLLISNRVVMACVFTAHHQHMRLLASGYLDEMTFDASSAPPGPSVVFAFLMRND